MGINNKQFLLNQIIWIGISLGISIIISILLPFPISLVAIVGVFILLSFYMRKIKMKRMGSGEGIFGSGIGSDKLKYYCMNCGSQHCQAACPKCGSQMKRVGS
ncbi:hypothetical protein [Nitrososphaera sp. AFS]|uniref:hypothetical protein n=1 Tax=Nitrososphaera sp. AFS TaxID=2301191 RepID=UPI00139222C6|nr:hypothetical protein [Nitrososphaera sp. AFS]NAL78874.1 hypothetical protein [Nitrososphaera sp. AFS]